MENVNIVKFRGAIFTTVSRSPVIVEDAGDLVVVASVHLPRIILFIKFVIVGVGVIISSLIIGVVIKLIETNEMARVIIIESIAVKFEVAEDINVARTSINQERSLSNVGIGEFIEPFSLLTNARKLIQLFVAESMFATSSLVGEPPPRVGLRRADTTKGSRSNNSTGTGLNGNVIIPEVTGIVISLLRGIFVVVPVLI